MVSSSAQENGGYPAESSASEPARAKNIRKKLTQILDLERRRDESADGELTQEQMEKVRTKTKLEKELKAVLAGEEFVPEPEVVAEPAVVKTDAPVEEIKEDWEEESDGGGEPEEPKEPDEPAVAAEKDEPSVATENGHALDGDVADQKVVARKGPSKKNGITSHEEQPDEATTETQPPKVARCLKTISARVSKLTRLYTLEDTAVYESASSWVEVGSMFQFDLVIAAGAPVAADGYYMVPIKPRGAIDLMALEVLEAGQQPPAKQKPPQAAPVEEEPAKSDEPEVEEINPNYVAQEKKKPKPKKKRVFQPLPVEADDSSKAGSGASASASGSLSRSSGAASAWGKPPKLEVEPVRAPAQPLEPVKEEKTAAKDRQDQIVDQAQEQKPEAIAEVKVKKDEEIEDNEQEVAEEEEAEPDELDEAEQQPARNGKTKKSKKAEEPELSGVKSLKKLQATAKLVSRMTRLYANQDTAVYESASSWDEVGGMLQCDVVIAAGPPVQADGYFMVPIKPRGAVDLAALTVLEAGAQPPQRKKPPPLEPPPMLSPGPSCRSPSMRWEEDPLGVEDIAPPKKLIGELTTDKNGEVFELIEGVQPFGVTAQESKRMKDILKEVTDLSQDAFEEDALHMVTRKSRWKLTLLAEPEGANGVEGDLDLDPPLIGFIVYRLRPEHEAFSIAKLAVVTEHRGKGHGRRLIDWAIRFAKKQQNITFISLSSLPEAVPFYKKIGFRPVEVTLKTDLEEGEELVEGQIYMEYRIKGKGGRKKK